MSGSIEEVGARLVLSNRAAFTAGVREAKASVKDLGVTATEANKQIADSAKLAADAQTQLAERITAASAATDKAMAAKTAAVRAAAAGDEQAAVAAKAYASAMNDEMIAANNEVRAARAQVAAAKANTTALRAQATAHDANAAAVSRSGAAMTALGKVGKVALLGGLATATGLAYEGAKAFGTFQQALEATHTQAGLTQGRVDALGKSLLSLTGSGKIPLDPTTMATILYRIASSTSGMHYDNARIMDMVKAAAQLTVIGGPNTDPEQTARIIGGVRATGVKGAGNPQSIAALANATVGSGDLTMNDFVQFVASGVLSSARLTGVTLPQIGGALALEGDNLQSGSVSGHSLAHALQLLAAPSSVGIQAYQAIGLPGTEIGNMMRTPGQGLPAALGDLTKHLMSPGSINPNLVIGSGMNAKTVAQYLESYGWSPTQVQQAAKVGLGAMGPTGKTLEDSLLARMFGGAKQAIPIMTLITEQSRYRAKVNQQQGALGNFPNAWAATMKEPANQLKTLQTQFKTFEIEVGQKVVPVLITVAHWFENNTGLVKGLALAVTAVLAPAVGVYLGTKLMAGVNALSNFGRGVQSTTTGTAKLGSTAEAQVGGLNTLAKGVVGVTTAIGIFGAGYSTGSQGTTGAVEAGLGGAVSGLVAGLAVGGPLGGAIGAAGGLLVGLAGHFIGAANATSQQTQALRAQDNAMQAWMRTAYKADHYKTGSQFRQSLVTQLGQPQYAGLDAAMHAADVHLPVLLAALKGNDFRFEQTISQALRAGKITQNQFDALNSGLRSLSSNFSAMAGQSTDLASLVHKTTQYGQDEAARIQSYLNQIAEIHIKPLAVPGFKGTVVQHGGSGGLGNLLTVPGGKPKHRALGGPVSVGSLYSVNEHGVELFAPSVPGVVIPHHVTVGSDGASAGHGHSGVVVVQPGAVVVYESHDPHKTYDAVKRGIADAVARQ